MWWTRYDAPADDLSVFDQEGDTELQVTHKSADTGTGVAIETLTASNEHVSGIVSRSSRNKSLI